MRWDPGLAAQRKGWLSLADTRGWGGGQAEQGCSESGRGLAEQGRGSGWPMGGPAQGKDGDMIWSLGQIRIPVPSSVGPDLLGVVPVISLVQL